MVELPQGDIIEERRGGAGILATLISEMVKLDLNGYIRCERTPAEAMPRVGQVIISSGTISAAIHEGKTISESVDALIEIETDCNELDCVMQLIEAVDVSRILDLHPNARLNVETPEKSRSSEWWNEVSNRSNSWTKSSRLPTIEASEDTPEFIQAKAAAMVHKHSTGGKLLKPGCVYSNDTKGLFTLVSNLKAHGKPVLVISRRTRDDLVTNYNLLAEDCLWLSQTEADGVQFVDIDAIKSTVYDFLEGNLRAVLLLDGLEYLANICSAKEALDMVRELGDRMRFEDDCLLVACDKAAWSKSESAQLIRAAPHLETETLEAWNNDSESLLDHPLMSPPTEEELLRLAEFLDANTPQQFSMELPTEDPVEIVMPEQKEVEEIDIVSVEEEIIITENKEEASVEDVSPTKTPKGPRTAQRIKRRKSKHSPVMSGNDARNAGLAAATSGKIVAEMPSEELLPKTTIGPGREGKMPVIPEIIPNALNDVVKQEATQRNSQLPQTKLGPKLAAATKTTNSKKVISPVAARGIEVKRNLKNRSQASSLPQRKIDLDKELMSWKNKNEEEEA
jgi:hypothetical protein